MICHRKGPATALQIRENAISTFSMQGLEPLLEHALKIHAGVHARLSSSHYMDPCCGDRGQRPLEESFGLQAELDRGGCDLARCCLIVLEDLERLAESCCRDFFLTKHNARAHEASP